MSYWVCEQVPACRHHGGSQIIKLQASRVSDDMCKWGHITPNDSSMKCREHTEARREIPHVRTQDKSDADRADDGKQGKMPFRYGKSQKDIDAKQGEIFALKVDFESLNAHRLCGSGTSSNVDETLIDVDWRRRQGGDKETKS